ncbi:hypothetical protein J4E83_005218 [Alternaria metachromatica]|uniref:uncharacterized protein n=1 Tax=Alternaria metachromatica TaxID=283354 RepID=UPI0020C21467|nr:uncharacterized protein J4E83_005218 [Alternaria metachromatica]KAI4620856.1 hypothetical protein J4E83_005218 [Alternaria metachromatica]
MASPEKVAELAARLGSLADSISTHGDPRERSKTSLQEAAVELEQTVTKFHSRGDAHVLVLIDAHSHPFCNDVYYKSSDKIYSAFERVKPFNIKSRLQKAIKNYLIGISAVAALGASRLIVRLYANSAKLENDILRPLQQFAVQFSSIDADFDFIGVQDEATVELKVSSE